MGFVPHQQGGGVALSQPHPFPKRPGHSAALSLHLLVAPHLTLEQQEGFVWARRRRLQETVQQRVGRGLPAQATPLLHNLEAPQSKNTVLQEVRVRPEEQVQDPGESESQRGD